MANTTISVDWFYTFSYKDLSTACTMTHFEYNIIFYNIIYRYILLKQLLSTQKPLTAVLFQNSLSF